PRRRRCRCSPPPCSPPTGGTGGRPWSGRGTSFRILLQRPEVTDVEDAAAAFLPGPPDGLDAHPDPDLLLRHVAEVVHHPHLRGGPIAAHDAAEDPGQRLAGRPSVLRVRPQPGLRHLAFVQVRRAQLDAGPLLDAFAHDDITTTEPYCMRSPQACATPVWTSCGICRLPAWFVSCQKSSPIFWPIVAAIGLPTPIRPPEGQTGRSPSRSVTPSRVRIGASPFFASSRPSR